MPDKPPDTSQKAGSRAKAPASVDANELRADLPRQIEQSGLFDVDYEPAQIDRLREIFEYLPDRAVVNVSNRLKSLDNERTPDLTPFVDEFGISAAERKLLESLVEGLTVVAHAGRTSISVNTARTHMRRLLEKTGSSGQLDLVKKTRGDR